MIPTPKNSALDADITRITGIDRRAVIQGGKCAFDKMGCRGPNFTFRDDLSRREYAISGLCQGCQDAMFGM